MLTKHDVQDLLTVARSIRGVCSDQRFDGRRKAEIVIERAHVLACGLELLLEDVPDVKIPRSSGQLDYATLR